MWQRFSDFLNSGVGTTLLFVVVLGAITMTLTRRAGRRTYAWLASIGASMLPFFGQGDCEPGPPTPPPTPTCYDPMYITPTPEVTATPELTPIIMCYDVAEGKMDVKVLEAASLVDHLNVRLTTLDRLASQERVQPEVAEKVLVSIEKEVDQALAQAQNEDLEPQVRQQIEALSNSAREQVARIRSQLRQ